MWLQFFCDLDFYVIVAYCPSYRQENNVTLIFVLLKLCLGRGSYNGRF